MNEVFGEIGTASRYDDTVGACEVAESVRISECGGAEKWCAVLFAQLEDGFCLLFVLCEGLIYIGSLSVGEDLYR